MNNTTEVKVFLFAGVKTSPSYFYSLRNQLQHQYNKRNIDSEIEILFPYGERGRNLVMQVAEVRADLSALIKAAGVGGKKIWNKIEPHVHLPKLLLIGHSGGGVAAYRVARRIYEEQLPIQTNVIQIGSPKTRIMPQLQSSVSYIRAINQDGIPKDPVTKLGSWGGWSIRKQDQMKIPYWDSNKYAPSRIINVDTIGGHADYFRESPTFVDELSRCNLEKTMEKIDLCLNEWL